MVELLVVISIISVLLAIVVPAVNLARRQARSLLGMRNQREVANAVNLFAVDNDDRYPDSVATIGFGDSYRWADPAKMIGIRERSPQLHRAMSAYLGNYVEDAAIMFCPSAPQEHLRLQEAWGAGDDWDNPDTERTSDPFTGTYCFYWNYVGYLAETDTVFRGPTGPASSGRYSQLLVTDYLGYDHWRSPNAFGSCEQLPGADIIPETQLQSSYWAAAGDPNTAMPEVKLRAAYTDGHVETYSPSEVTPLKVSFEPEGKPPYTDYNSGIFFLPRDAVQ